MAERIGILLVNLGTPQAPTTREVRRFLREFLSDPRVIDLPKLVWRALLNLIILPIRSRSVAKKYQLIWQQQGSPLFVYSQHLAIKLQQALEQDESHFTVALAMRYGKPDIMTALLNLRQKKISQLLILPLYPQYSATTTASVFDAVAKAFAGWPDIPTLQFISDYHQSIFYIAAMAQSIKQQLGDELASTHLVFSYHGLPQRYCDKGDPYYQQCLATTMKLADALALTPAHYTVSFQSQFGRAKWLKPSSLEVVQQLPAQGIKKIAVVCPGFACDCLETLEEVALGLKEAFLQAQGECFTYIPALNESPLQVEFLRQFILAQTQGWIIARDK